MNYDDLKIFLLIYAGVSAFAAFSLKKQTNFSISESIVLGLTTAIPALFCLIADFIQLLAVSSLKLGFLLGGKEYTEVIQSFLSKQIGKNITVVKGDGSDSEGK